MMVVYDKKNEEEDEDKDRGGVYSDQVCSGLGGDIDDAIEDIVVDKGNLIKF